MMKKNISFLIAAFSAALPALAAAGPNFDFDGTFAQVSAGRATAVSALNAAADGVKLLPALAPEAGRNRGDIPQVPPPTCVGDDCGGTGQPPYYPQPGPSPHPNPSPQPNPQPWTPPSQPLPAQGPFAPSEDFYKKPFIASFCLSMGEGSSSCRQGSGLETAKAISDSFRKDLIEELGKNGITFVFPVALGPAEVHGALKTALQHGIDLLAASLQADLDTLTQDMDGNGWGTPTDKARMMRIIVKNEQLIKLWKAAALLEAETGRNWKMGFSKPNSYKFIGGPAYEQLREGLLNKEIFTGNSRKRLAKKLG